MINCSSQNRSTLWYCLWRLINIPYKKINQFYIHDIPQGNTPYWFYKHPFQEHLSHKCNVLLQESKVRNNDLTGLAHSRQFPRRTRLPSTRTARHILLHVPLTRTTDLLSRLKLLNYHQSMFLLTLVSSLELNNNVPFFFNASTLYCKHYKVLQNKTLNK